jgi:hypothetical protein
LLLTVGYWIKTIRAGSGATTKAKKMAILTGAIKYRGSFKSIRNYMNLHDPKTYAGEKGGANRDLIMNHPAFALTRENMNEFKGVGAVVKAIRRGLLNLLPEQTDKLFTSRLMRVVKEINRRDYEGEHGKRAIIISGERPFFQTMVFNVLASVAENLQTQFSFEHPIGRGEATLSLTAFNIKDVMVPLGATHYRVQNHVSIISDYTYVEANRRYEPLSQLNALSAHAYSEYTPVGTDLTDEIVASFSLGTTPGTDDSVIQCVGIEFYLKSGATSYKRLVGSSMFIVDVF